MNPLRPPNILTSLAVFLPVAALAFNTERIEDPDVRECANRALPTNTASQIQTVEVTGKNGYVRKSQRLVYWKRAANNDSKMLVRVTEPQSDAGVAVLIDDNATRNLVSYMSYSPKIKRVRRVTGESFFGSILGTDFTYEDFSYFYRVDEREQVRRVDDSVIDGFNAYVLETTKPGDNSHYSLARFYIDEEKCVPIRTDFFAPNGSLRKQLLIDRSEIKQVDGHWVPFRSTMTDLKLNTNSVFIVEEVAIDPDLDEGLFEVSSLRSSNH